MNHNYYWYYLLLLFVHIDSLHIGNLLSIVALTQFQRSGHTPIAVVRYSISISISSSYSYSYSYSLLPYWLISVDWRGYGNDRRPQREELREDPPRERNCTEQYRPNTKYTRKMSIPLSTYYPLQDCKQPRFLQVSGSTVQYILYITSIVIFLIHIGILLSLASIMLTKLSIYLYLYIYISIWIEGI